MPKPSRRSAAGSRRGPGPRLRANTRRSAPPAKPGGNAPGVSIAARELAGVRELIMLAQLQEGAKSYEEIKEDYERFTKDRVHHRAMYRIIKGLMDSKLVEYPEAAEISRSMAGTRLNYYVVAPRGRVVLKAMSEYLNVAPWASGARRSH
jgi:DNA-binding PadR family transcriptional regulator